MSDPNNSNNKHDAPIYMATMSAGTNIAVIKYWGKADATYNTPINSSMSVTLDQSDLRAVTTCAASHRFTSDQLWLNGVLEESAATNPRFRACIDQVKALATDKTDAATGNILVSKQDWQQMHIHVSSYNTFPTAAGLASSAAGYAALVATLAHLVGAVETFPGQLSTIARQGSGSACRSLYGGCVAWRHGTPPDWLDSKAELIADETHWPELRALILVVSDLKKDTSSTSGMATSVATSALLPHRASQVVPERMTAMEAAYHKKDFGTFGKLTMQDSNQFHATCLDTYPPIFYMNGISHGIIRIVTAYNAWCCSKDGDGSHGIRAAYTFDAGPNAVIYCLDEHVAELGALLLHYYPSPDNNGSSYVNQPSFVTRCNDTVQLDPSLLAACDKTGRAPQSGDVQKIYYTRAGPGPLIVTDHANLDPTTGLNCYDPTTMKK